MWKMHTEKKPRIKRNVWDCEKGVEEKKEKFSAKYPK
jgi:hypothetical protein